MNSAALKLAQAREMLRDLTPLHTDCGLLCGSACCQGDADGQGGVWLFPGEERWYRNATWARIVPDEFAPMLVCEGSCPRELRPLGCRFFPLCPQPRRAGEQRELRVDRRSRAMCPLSSAGLRGFDPAFVDAVREAFALLDEESAFAGFLDAWARREMAFSRFRL